MTPSSLAGHAIELLDRVVKSSLPSDRVVQDFYRERRYLGSHDRRWITERLYGIIRNFILLRDLCGKCGNASSPFHVFLAYEIAVAGSGTPQLNETYSQLLESYKMSGEKLELEDFAACINKRLEEVKGNSSSAHLAFSFPDFFHELLPESIRGEAVPIMIALNREARVCLRVDTNRIQREEVARIFREKGVETEPAEYSPMGLYLPRRINLNNERLYRDGLIEIQEEASQLVGLLLNPRKDEIIVDACAGAGGKSLEIAALSAGGSRIYALDVDEGRLGNLGTRAERSGYTNISPLRISGNSLDNAASLIGAADKVVVDAPCSGSGTIRRNPDKKFRLTRSAVHEHAAYQETLLRRYAELVKIGGLLVYSTCSIFSEENFGVIATFLQSDGRFAGEDVSLYLSEPKFAELFEAGCLAIYPHRHEMDGFFAAVMKRVS
jgi:16S rRNA (cytosine967-C5)-methyltransferase